MSNIKQATNQFSPILHCICNLIGLVAVFAAGVIISVFSPINNIMLCVGIVFVIYSWKSMAWWSDDWLARDKEVRKLDIADARALENWTNEEKNELVRKIRRRSSGLFGSFVMYFIPHAIWLGIWYTMFGSFQPIVPY